MALVMYIHVLQIVNINFLANNNADDLICTIWDNEYDKWLIKKKLRIGSSPYNIIFTINRFKNINLRILYYNAAWGQLS